MSYPSTDPAVAAAASVLAGKHEAARYNEYGACTASGYRIDEGRDGMARVMHVVPNVDLFDPERPSDDELAEERQEMVLVYADTLEAAGWTVIRRGPRSRKPYLLGAQP
ncbi:hypothetical protein ACIRLA_22020 [Streptomyces sp. NPDC102364]|uniref:hypothetical protein n=1 Tax=Streptomyces sp. NPDC102364 TaxID=3366161 RepID=UPI0037F8F41B